MNEQLFITAPDVVLGRRQPHAPGCAIARRSTSGAMSIADARLVKGLRPSRWLRPQGVAVATGPRRESLLSIGRPLSHWNLAQLPWRLGHIEAGARLPRSGCRVGPLWQAGSRPPLLGRFSCTRLSRPIELFCFTCGCTPLGAPLTLPRPDSGLGVVDA